MDDLVRWLGEQLDEDERIARAIPVDLGHEWSDPGPWVMAGSGGGGREAEVAKAADGLEMPLAEVVTHHIAEHDPARVLREIDAKRKLIARGGPFCTSNCDAPGNEPTNPDTNWTTPLEHHFDCAAYEAAGVLALPYADRPGYREEWAPIA